MAVARHNTSAAKIPNHMPAAARGAPYEAWMKNVSQRNAPGAISAIALTVRPVRPNVALDVDGAGSDGIRCSFSLRAFQRAEAASLTHDACDWCPDTSHSGSPSKWGPDRRYEIPINL